MISRPHVLSGHQLRACSLEAPLHGLVPRRRTACRANLVTESAVQPQSPLQLTKYRKFRLPERYVGLCWERWELLMFERLESLEAAQELNATAKVEIEEDDADMAEKDQGAPVGERQALTSAYFLHYDNPAAHEAWLRDRALVSAYRDVIMQHAELLRDKVVLDVGCGPGLLAMLCAQAGARHIFAVEGSEASARVAERIVEANGLSSRISVINADVEDLQLQDLGGQPVDVIVCNWMAPLLLAGGMLRSLAVARRRLLKPDGLLLPDRAQLHVLGIEDKEYLLETKQRWDKIAGLNMGPAMTQVVKQPRVDSVTRNTQIFTDSCQLLDLDLRQLTWRQLSAGFSAPFKLTALREERLFALMVYFDTTFTFGGQVSEPVLFSTGPKAPLTHFQQLIINFPKSVKLAKGDKVNGVLSWRPRNLNARELDVDLQVEYKGVVAEASYVVPLSLAL